MNDPIDDDAELIQAEPVAEDVVRDAERYRWLRREATLMGSDPFIVRYNGSFIRWTGVDADAVIDAAIAKEKAK